MPQNGRRWLKAGRVCPTRLVGIAPSPFQFDFLTKINIISLSKQKNNIKKQYKNEEVLYNLAHAFRSD
jgi:hypothetical protein